LDLIQGIVKRKIRALTKNFAKLIVCFIPQGDRWWRRKRESMLSDLTPLPLDMPLSPVDISQLTPLNPDCINQNYRVIYVIAEK
jgi:hypothetical protein